MFSRFREARAIWWRVRLEAKRSPEWRRVRKAHLLRQPRCMACDGDEKLQVHHMRPFHLHPELELDEANLITLCEKPGHDCHFVFGHFHDWTLFNPNVIEDVARYRTEHRRAREPEYSDSDL